MRHVVIPETIAIKDPNTGVVIQGLDKYGMSMFVDEYIISNPQIGLGMDALRRVRKLERSFEGVPAKTIVPIEDADFNVVTQILNSVEWKNPRIGVQVLPFFEAWEDAAKQDEEWFRKQSMKSVPNEATVP